MARYFTDHDVMLSSTRFLSPFGPATYPTANAYSTAAAPTATSSGEAKAKIWYVLVKGPGQIESGATTEEAADIEDEVKKRFPSATLKVFASEAEATAYISSLYSGSIPATPPPPTPMRIPWGMIAAGGALIAGLLLLKRR